MSVNKLKTGIVSFGTSIVDHSTNLKDTLTFQHKDYDVDDDLIKHYKYDIEKAIGGLKYIDHQTSRQFKTHYSRLFKLNIAIVHRFISLIGKDSLHFKGIEDYYNDFDKFQATQVIPMVHPKEKDIVIESVNHELFNYLSTIERLKWKVSRSWELHTESIHLRVSEMNGYLTETLKLIRKRNKKQRAYHETDKKINKLSKKNTPLDDKETEKLKKYEKDIKDLNAEYNKLNEKLKSILPHVISFLDEFIETITQIILHQQITTYEEIKNSIKYFAMFHGYLSSEAGEGEEDHIQSFETIEDEWEKAITPTRLQIESFITVIFEKKPELLDTEIEDKDKTTMSNKIWNKMSKTVTERKHEHKSKDHVNGTFNDTLEADPLTSYIKFEDSNMYRSETYFPSKLVSSVDVKVPKPIVNPNLPPLPPRSNTAETLKILPPTPILHQSIKPSAPVPPPYTPVSYNNSYSEESIDDDEGDADDMSSIKSDISVESVSSDFILHNSAPDLVNKNLRKAYNSSKNDIKFAPITSSLKNDFINNSTSAINSVVFNKTSSVSYKLLQINEFFTKLTNTPQKDRRLVTALYDYDGVEPGDLSFKKGDQVEVVFDFQQIDTLYNESNTNWLIGSTISKTNQRIGFIPSNYFS
ncbi:hypothetical protein DFJ63DRAFT_312010 [Scheffersomyces coipomensis]|uniref:uncharacterized protein n=1 Tax=Scheffersomyces coipomensis TaxID=1788519 RepID=UPI00315D3B55